MKATIHRGAHEIGGSCIELEADGHRLILDLGRPLWATRGEPVPLPNIPGLSGPDASLAGVVISHPHLDHYGLASALPAGTPLYMGEAAYRVLREAPFFTGGELPPPPVGFLRHRQPMSIGSFKVTPHLNDHSAFDAYSMLIEAGGRSLFYTGDIRGHGRKRRVFEQLLRRPPRRVDTLLMEGTHVHPGADFNHRGPSERDVENQIAELSLETRGMLLAVYSPQNIDRLVTFFRVALRTGRMLVMDLYTATIAAATGLASIPQASWDQVRVYIPNAQRRRVITEQAFERTHAVRAKRIYIEELRANASELVMTFRESMAKELGVCLAGAQAVWSLWPGYLKECSGAGLTRALNTLGVPLTIAHSSGHACVPDLVRLAGALEPERIVPIHSEAGSTFSELFANTTRRADGEVWLV